MTVSEILGLDLRKYVDERVEEDGGTRCDYCPFREGSDLEVQLSEAVGEHERTSEFEDLGSYLCEVHDLPVYVEAVCALKELKGVIFSDMLIELFSSDDFRVQNPGLVDPRLSERELDLYWAEKAELADREYRRVKCEEELQRCRKDLHALVEQYRSIISDIFSLDEVRSHVRLYSVWGYSGRSPEVDRLLKELDKCDEELDAKREELNKLSGEYHSLCRYDNITHNKLNK